MYMPTFPLTVRVPRVRSSFVGHSIIPMSYPRNRALPVWAWVISVFSADRVSFSSVARNVDILSLIWWASTKGPANPRRKSRVKEWLSDRRAGLSVAAGFPIAVPHEPAHSRFTIPFPSHRTFSFPEYGGPTVFIAHHAQVSSYTRACRCQCRRAPSHTACCSESVSTRNPGLYCVGSSTDENGY